MNRSRSLQLLAALLAGAAGLSLGGCTPGPRERCMAAREAVVTSQPGSAEIAYFQVIEELPRTSLQQPVTATATASTEWISGR